MSAFWCSNKIPPQPHPIPSSWGDPRNFRWVSLTEKYWCKLCRKYADDWHIDSMMHTRRKMYPRTYLWYLDENRQPSQEKVLAATPPPPEPLPDDRRENVLRIRPSRGYEVGVPAPPAGPPPALDAAADRPLLFSPYLDATKTARHIVESETLADPLKNYVSDEPDSMVSNRWHRYAEDTARAAHWWWNPVHHNICFHEDAPGPWCKYYDPATGRRYWYLSDEIWFWEDTGSTLC